MQLLARFWFWLYLQALGAVYLVKEQVISRPRSLPPYSPPPGTTIVITGTTATAWWKSTQFPC